ncbi:MAG: MAPEG family protein, partial [Alphaproteobacteria bacterium]|nr:MAPEG family protein [Alphaproteobacteria bacterium]
MLAVAVVLGLIHILLAAHFVTAERGVAWNIGPRDTSAPLTGKLAGRLLRAQENFKETFIFFAALVLALAVTGRHSVLTVDSCELYVAARILYLPLYALGIPGARTLVWLASLLGIV